MKTTQRDARIIFLGTPMFAVASLDILVKNNYHVAAVITAPDKPAGRGQELHQTEVKKYAVQKNIPVLQPEKLGDPDFLRQVKSLNAALQVVVAFRMMPEKLWNMPPLGTFNLHASLLPQYRGAAPINHAIMQGETETGVTTFFLKHEIDTGDILFSEKVSIGMNETAGELHDRLMITGAKLVLKTAEHVLSGEFTPVPQESIPLSLLKPAPKIYKSDCRINWLNDMAHVHNQVRGLSPYPAAWTELSDPGGIMHQVKIFRTIPVVSGHDHAPGTISTDGKSFLNIHTPGGFVSVLELQLSGRKRMPADELLRGFHIDNEWRAV